MERVCVYRTETCSRRKLDAKKISNYFLENGYELVDKPQKADIIVLVTCAYVEDLAEFSLNKVKDFKNLKAELIVAGCLPDTDKERLARIFNGKSISTKDIDNFDNFFKDNLKKFKNLDDAHLLWKNLDQRPFRKIDKLFYNKLNLEDKYLKIRGYLIKKIYGERSSVYNKMSLRFNKKTFQIRVSWGCPGNCSYCIIKKAIGPLKSKPFDQVINEFKQGLNESYKNFVISADDIGSYGIDIKRNFPELLEELTNIEGDYQIEIESLNPIWIVKYIDDLEKIVKKGKIVRLSSSIQAGNSRILRLMNRYSDTEKMKKAFLRLKKAYPSIIFGTEIIVGFPTEKQEELEETLNFIKTIKFDWILFHPYSERSGTKSETFDPKITQEEIEKRMKFSKEFLTKFDYFFIKSPWSESQVANIKPRKK